MFELHNPDLVVVTGTASGLGTVLATSCLESGAKVIGFDLDQPGGSLTGHAAYTHVAGSVTEEAAWERVGALVDA